MMTIPTTSEIIQYKTEYVVERNVGGQKDEFRSADINAAHERARQAVQVGAGEFDDGETFGGSVTWYIDDTVPATYFDEICAEYDGRIHGVGDLDDLSIGRDDRYMVVQENVRGGFWLTTGDDPGEIVSGLADDEYANEWETTEIHDLQEGRELDFSISTTVVTT